MSALSEPRHSIDDGSVCTTVCAVACLKVPSFFSPSLCGCSDRGDEGRVFGDMVHTFHSAVERPDVDGCNDGGSEDDLKDLCVRAEGESLSAEGQGTLKARPRRPT